DAVDAHGLTRAGGEPATAELLIDDATASVNKGFARVCELIFPRSQTAHADPKGCAAGAPNVPDMRGGFGGGGPPPLALLIRLRPPASRSGRRRPPVPCSPPSACRRRRSAPRCPYTG